MAIDPANSNIVPSATSPTTVHVLFMDIVSFSTSYTVDQQDRVAAQLNEVVAATSPFREALAANSLISLPAGDGMALVFVGGPLDAPLKCAIEIAQALKKDPFCRLRMGMHSGLVMIAPDINGKPNVTGDGINLSQRVMSLGGDGHILVSGSIAESLQNLSAWQHTLKYLGDYKAKKNWVRVWNYMYGDVGSAKPLVHFCRQTQTKIRFATAALVLLVLAVSFPWLRSWYETMSRIEHSVTVTLSTKNSSGSVEPQAPGAVLPSKTSIKLRLDSREDGFVYLLAEGPQGPSGRTWIWLFPEPNFQAGSAQMSANKNAQVPSATDDYIQLADLPGKETVLLFWSNKPIDSLESVKKAVFERASNGNSPELIVDEAATVAMIVAQYTPKSKTAARSDRTEVSGREDILASQLVLEHN